jgi:hypothetical protein
MGVEEFVKVDARLYKNVKPYKRFRKESFKLFKTLNKIIIYLF